MKWTKWIVAGYLLLTCQAGFSGTGGGTAGEAPGGDSLDRKALGAFLQRIVKDRASGFEIGYIAPEHGKDVFELRAGSAGGRILLRGSNGVSVASALNYYLRYYCHSLITWNGVNLHLPAVLPAPAAPVHKVTPYTWRYYLNYCTFQYSMSWWDWDRWQQEIDWMALNGINMPLALTGEEGIWQGVYRSMGFSEAELDRFYTGPAFFSWLWMGNIDAWGGPLPAHWKEAHVVLQQKILRAERAMGMKTVLPAFTGHVPPSFIKRYPQAKVKKTNWDAGFPDVYILDPADPLFETIGRKYIEAQTAVFGTDHFYSADTFNENVPPTSDSSYLDEMSKKVYASMALADPKAVWVMQGWMFHYNASFWKPAQIQGLLKAVPDDRMIVLDLYSESHPLWNRTSSPGVAGSGSSEGQTSTERRDRANFSGKADAGAYYGKPWIWNMLHNFGGNVSLWGRMSHVAEDPSAALHDPASGKMVGIGLTPEGIEQNPALYQLMLENVWQDGPVKLDEWLQQYALQRYGVSDPSIDKAWKLLEGSVYRGGLGEGGNESIIVARPTMEKTIDRVLTKLDYDPARLVEAWGLFVRASPELGKNDGFRYDLVDITRQVLANYASPLQQRWVEAYRAHDTASYHRYSREFLVLLDDMDRLLSTRKDFLLGKWIAAARSNGITAAEKDIYELNARNLVTLWGDKESILREYSCRQWAGLIKGFYKPRWELFFQTLDRAMAAGIEPDLKNFDKRVKDQEWSWVNSHREVYTAVPVGDPVATVMELYRKYSGLVVEAKVTNDHIFPAAAAAKPFIDFDGKGFIINGRRTFLVSAGLEYARMPHELWKDRLLRLQRAGFNCVEIYTFWNYHEPRQGVFDFSGDHDLEAFLRLAASMGLYVIARVGPYYCAEWDNGGYPLWLRFQPGVRVREDNAAFEQHVDRFFDKLLPIVCRNQISKGGSVIMVQLENEHNDGWGTAVPNGYFRHLQEKALSMGVEVPYFFSGLHHASDPAGEETGRVAGWKRDPVSLDDASRLNPWLSTEFWSVWYNGYGSGEKEAHAYERRTWKIIAHGGGGYNYYMAYGGTNFGYTNNDEDAASYDYGAAVGQAGDLRPIYYSFKRAAWFARSFENILSNAVDATGVYAGLAMDSSCRLTARHSPAGDIVFYDNPSGNAVKTMLRSKAGWAAVPVTLGPGEILPVVMDHLVSDRVKLEWAPLRILGVCGAAGSRTIVVYGDAGAPARMVFSCKGPANVVKGRMTAAAGKLSLHTNFPGGAMPEEYLFTVGQDRIRILVMNRQLADRTWFPDDSGDVLVGPAYAGGLSVEKGIYSFVAEAPYIGDMSGEHTVVLYGKGLEPLVLKRNGVGGTPAAAVASTALLQPWFVKDAAQAAAPGFDDGGWMAADLAPQMGADGDGSPNAWYRTRIRIDSAGPYVLQVEGGDRAAVFVDGHFMAAGNIHDGEIPLTLTQGPHVLAIFTAHDGRDKLAGFTGDMLTVDRKGLTGLPRLERGASSSRETTGWRFLRAGGPAPGPVPSGNESGWMDYTIGKDMFSQKEGYGWFRTELPAPPAGVTKGMLSFRSVDENATVFINGRRIMRHEGWNIPFQIGMEGLDTMARPLVLTLFIENYSNEGGIDRPVKVNYLKDVLEVRGWRMHGGIGEPGTLSDWKPLVQGEAPAGSPRYYRTEFTVPAYGARGDHPIYRVHTDGLGHGSVWVNGQNLGRYPEKVPAPGLYIPECWMKDGINELVIYEEDGGLPGQVSVRQEPAAGRTVDVYSNGPAVQSKDPFSFVDPFIGTGKSVVYTRWGNEGGTYPGAVAPWGYMQLSPETKEGKGYDHADSTICYFSCAHHLSGYPNGSAGDVRIMPVKVGTGIGDAAHGDGHYARPFIHGDEYANPGYYRVRFADDGSVVEATASVRAGVFRFTFPAGVSPVIFVGGIGELRAGSDRELTGKGLPAAIAFSEAFTLHGDLLDFKPAATGPTTIVMIVSVSPMGAMDAALRAGSAVEGMGAAWPAVFDTIRKATEEAWRQQLGVVTIGDARETQKKIFYTALYHTMLLPWIVSNADGFYQGVDRKVHRSSGKDSYGGFSPWDTFRSLHPLISLLFPERQRDMVSSLMDMYRDGGQIPAGPMTGDHAIPVIVDSWLKGIRAGDSSEVYTALRKGAADTPYSHEDRAVYLQKGYVPLSYPESVTRTVEYAFDDWSLSEFAAKVMHRDRDAAVLMQRGNNYQRVFDPEAMLMLPRSEAGVFRRRLGTSGYKEGDPWVYSYFVPQHPENLVDLMGGKAPFAERLDAALTKGDIVFDNETVFHIPYLFNYAMDPEKTQAWVRAFRDGRFTASPGGLPGNDDMGSMSSWYVFSAMGFYPVCPGRPVYDLGTPLFRSMRLRPAGGKEFVIEAPALDETHTHIGSVRVNGEDYHRLVLPHALVAAGGRIEFGMGSLPSDQRALVVKKGPLPVFTLSEIAVSRRRWRPHQLVRVRFKLHNAGAMGTKIVQLMGDGREIGRRNCLVDAGATLFDSVSGRLYAYGRVRLQVGGMDAGEVEVVRDGQRPENQDAAVEVSALTVKPLLTKDEEQLLRYTVQNIGGDPARVDVPARVNEQVVLTDHLILGPGEKKTLSHRLPAGSEGLANVAVLGAMAVFKRYEDPMGSLLLDLGMDSMGGGSGLVRDRSGFGNDGRVIGNDGRVMGSDGSVMGNERKPGPLRFGKDSYVEVDNAPSLDRMGETLTMMARVFPAAPGEMLVDIFTKGDNHVLQIADNKSLTFFAGGWGRGDCTVALPPDWFGHWHHIAGVCTGGELFVYIDGILKGTAKVDGKVDLSVENKWVLGRNEEFPGQRVFEGMIGDAKVFAAPLSAANILYFSKRRVSSPPSLP